MNRQELTSYPTRGKGSYRRRGGKGRERSNEIFIPLKAQGRRGGGEEGRRGVVLRDTKRRSGFFFSFSGRGGNNRYFSRTEMGTGAQGFTAYCFLFFPTPPLACLMRPLSWLSHPSLPFTCFAIAVVHVEADVYIFHHVYLSL